MRSKPADKATPSKFLAPSGNVNLVVANMTHHNDGSTTSSAISSNTAPHRLVTMEQRSSRLIGFAASAHLIAIRLSFPSFLLFFPAATPTSPPQEPLLQIIVVLFLPKLCVKHQLVVRLCRPMAMSCFPATMDTPESPRLYCFFSSYLGYTAMGSP
jgi:hypothetical protein